MKDVFIIGSKGLPAKYGGFETFVQFLTDRRINKDIVYHISCMSNNDSEFLYNNARCFNINVPNIGNSKAVLYDILSIRACIKYIKKKAIKNAVVYILACRIGPFFSYYKKKLERLGAKVFVNPDGHEWKRSKWNLLIRNYWKLSEKMMIKNSDLVVCDSKGIETYIKKEYKDFNPVTTFIAYGADITSSSLEDSNEKIVKWFYDHSIKSKEYYLVVGRFVPENNYELMIREFMLSSSKKDFVIISNIEHNSFFEDLLEKTNFKKDPRIKFVGTVYDQELLKKIREQAYGYFHGHEVGGTNPSLLEALASTELNLLLDVVFNKEVGEDGAIYFTKNNGSLAELIEKADSFLDEDIKYLSYKAKERIEQEYSWDKIVKQYEFLFLTPVK